VARPGFVYPRVIRLLRPAPSEVLARTRGAGSPSG
jgi:hypothetical protein